MNNITSRFRSSFNDGMGSCYAVCACGREHYDSSDNHWDWEDGELENLIERDKTDPNVIGQDGSIGGVELMGCRIIDNCECDLAEKYENFLLRHAEQIADYLRSMAKEMKEKSESLTI